MHTLEEIYQRQATLEANQEAIEARLEAIEQQAASQVPEGMVLIPAGDFVMGDTFGDGNPDELPVHSVTVSAFYMGETEVTKTQWDAVHGWAVTNGYAFENAGLGKAGNQWEWFEDVYVDSYEGTPTDGSAQTSGGSGRVSRGGSWDFSARYVRSTSRYWFHPSISSPYLGFRVCLGRSR
jgi:formylglycine-generating enzyme required for sulfatase activity